LKLSKAAATGYSTPVLRARPESKSPGTESEAPHVCEHLLSSSRVLCPSVGNSEYRYDRHKDCLRCHGSAPRYREFFRRSQRGEPLSLNRRDIQGLEDSDRATNEG
jgi:hypothetical protein